MPGFRVQAPPVVERTLLVLSISVLTAAAWASLWASSNPAYGFLHHHQLGHEGAEALPILLFVTGWVVMTVAMMLPTSVPLVTTFHAIAGRRSDRALLITLVVTGYILTWSVFGVLVYGANRLVQWLIHASSQPDALALGGPLLLLLAGAFQFTSLKYRCLDKCRSALSFVIEHWRGSHDRWQAFRLGVDHGIFCVGCCWALMLLMFVVGAGSLGWMFVLAVVMATEKNVSWGRKMSAPLGAVLLAWGATLLLLG